jgi:hypothetical protein
MEEGMESRETGMVLGGWRREARGYGPEASGGFVVLGLTSRAHHTTCGARAAEGRLWHDDGACAGRTCGGAQQGSGAAAGVKAWASRCATLREACKHTMTLARRSAPDS